jgi:predicted Zn finger-like uncharacterized protein
MILTCPQCATRYQTDASLFAPPGRKVKCAKCSHVWLQSVTDPEQGAIAEEPAPPEPVRDAVTERAAYAPAASSYAPHREEDAPSVDETPRPSWGRRLGLAVGWLVLAAIVLVIGWSADTYRQQIASLWPQSSSLYSALGLRVNARGIDVRDVFDRIEKEDGQSVLAISGTLLNISRRELTVPKVSVTLTDDDKRTLYQWSFSSGVETLKPGQSVRFRTRLSSPPAGVRHLEVRLGGSAG